MPRAPIVNAKSIEMGVRGQFYVGSETDPKTPPAVLPYHDDGAESRMQLFLSTFLLNSLMQSVFETQKLNFTVDNSMIPK
jgi:hypothetical protein